MGQATHSHATPAPACCAVQALRGRARPVLIAPLGLPPVSCGHQLGRPLMAMTPCSLCGRMYRGKANAAYPTILAGQDRWTAKVKLCQDCWIGVLSRFETAGCDAQADMFLPFMPQYCIQCGEPLGPNALGVFCTAYPAGEERRDWYAQVDERCAPELERAWRLSKAT